MKLPQALCDAIKNGPLDEAIHRDWVLSWFANRSRPTAIEMRGILYPDKPSTEQQKRWLLCLKILLEFSTIRAVDLSSNQLTSMMSAVLDLFAPIFDSKSRFIQLRPNYLKSGSWSSSQDAA